MLSRIAARTLPRKAHQASTPVCEICGQSAVCDIDQPTVTGPMSLAVVWGTRSQARNARPTRLCFECLAHLLDDQPADSPSDEDIPPDTDVRRY